MAPASGADLPPFLSSTAPDGTAIALHLAGDGPPVLLVHGAAADARQWARVVPLLAATHTVATMDRRGRGGSGPLRPDHSLATEYGDVAAAAATLAAAGGRVAVVGHSSGARFALHAALQAPDLAALVLYEPPPPEHLPRPVLDDLAALEAAGDREGILRTFLLEAAGNDEAALAELRARPIWPIMLDNALTLPAELRAVAPYRFDRSAVADLAVPTLCLLGEESGPELRRVTEEIVAALPDASLLVLAGQGHGAMMSAPALFVAEVRRFLDVHPG
ncbi:MAG: alpha/beta fold hydrolase [Acidimicrobiales bacterium]